MYGDFFFLMYGEFKKCGNISLYSKKTFTRVVCVRAFVHILLSNKHKHIYIQMHRQLWSLLLGWKRIWEEVGDDRN